MRERVVAVEGSLEIVSSIGAGTAVTIALPYSPVSPSGAADIG
jgi:signal transduction histidine kinase